jgi:hypothetical protein
VETSDSESSLNDFWSEREGDEEEGVTFGPLSLADRRYHSTNQLKDRRGPGPTNGRDVSPIRFPSPAASGVRNSSFSNETQGFGLGGTRKSKVGFSH